MIESSDCILRYKHLITYGAVLTFGKTCFGTGGSFVCIDYLFMTASGNDNVHAAYLSVTNGTVNYVVVRTCALTIGSNFVFYLGLACGVTESGKDNVHAAYLSITNGTVNYVVVRTVVHTVGKDLVFYLSLACGVTESGNDNVHAAERYVTYVTVNNDVVRTVVYAIGNGDGFFY